MPKQNAGDDFQAYAPLVGKAIVDRYTSADNAPCVVGKDRFSYVDIARLTGMPAGRASRIISRVAKELHATSLADLYKRSTPLEVAGPGFGSCSVLLLLRLFEGLGFDSDAWAAKGWTKEKVTTFDSFKRRGEKREKRRKRGRRG